MKLTSDKALKMLEETRKDFENQGMERPFNMCWQSAGKIAEALNKK